MSLYIGLLWMACALIALGVFVLCRKRLADIAHQVAEETEHRARRILETERAIEERLCENFVAFQNQGQALQAYKSAQAGIEGIPRCNPAWKWTAADLEQARKLAEARETSRRCRSPVVGSIIAVLAMTLGAAVATVILSDSVRPELATSLPPALTNTSASTLPPPVYLPSLGVSLPASASPVDPVSSAPVSASTAPDPAVPNVSVPANQPGEKQND